MMRSTQRLLAAHREIWDRAKRHPFLRLLERPPSERAFRRWLACELRWFERATAAIGCLLSEIPKSHRYVVAQALLLLTEELDWLEVHAEPGLEDPVVEYWGERIRAVFSEGWDRAMTVLWLGTRLFYEGMKPLEPEDELAREYWERRTSAVIEAFLHDFEELADVAIEALGMAEASTLLLEVVEGQMALWDAGLGLVEGKE